MSYNDRLYAKRIVRVVNRIMKNGGQIWVGLPGPKIHVKSVATCLNNPCIIVTDHEGFTHKVLPNSLINERGEQVCAKRP